LRQHNCRHGVCCHLIILYSKSLIFFCAAGLLGCNSGPVWGRARPMGWEPSLSRLFHMCYAGVQCCPYLDCLQCSAQQ
jgi:hypothetical protein